MPWYRRMPKERVERVARMDAKNKDAAAALGITPRPGAIPFEMCFFKVRRRFPSRILCQ